MDLIAWTASEIDILSEFERSDGIDEFEVRFGKYEGTRFEPGVSEQVFKGLLKFLSDSPQFTAGVPETNVFKVITESGKSNALIRGVEEFQKFVANPRNPSIVLERYIKQKTKQSDNENFGFRLSIAKDKAVKPTKQSSDELADTPKIFRLLQKRFGFETPDKEFRLDLSITKTSSLPSVDIDQKQFRLQPSRYEVEIEHIGKSRKTASNVLGKYVYLVLKYIQNSAFPIGQDEQYSIMKEYAEKYFKDGRYVKEALKTRQTWGRLFLGAMPVTLSLANVLPTSEPQIPNIRRPYPDDYTVTEKADGERFLLFVAGSGRVFLMSREGKVTKTGIFSSEPYTLIDGELIPRLRRFLAFDMLFDRGEDVRHLPLSDQGKSVPTRHNRMIKHITLGAFKTVEEPAMNIVPKKFYQTSDVIATAAEIWKDRFIKYSHHVDGIFFTPRGTPYPKVEYGSKTWYSCLKWKPRSLLSIDFAVKSEAAIKYSMLEGQVKPYKIAQLHVLIGGNRSAMVKTKPFEPKLVLPGRSLPTYLTRIEVDDQNRMMTLDPLSGARQEIGRFNQIVEFAYDRDSSPGFEWRPLRVRHDKTLPNREDAANQIWGVMNEANGQVASDNFFEILKDPLSEKHLQSELNSRKDVYYEKKETLGERKFSIVINIRSYHDRLVKQNLYNVASKISGVFDEGGHTTTLLELGVGKGGDYNRWRNAEIRTVIGIDYDKTGLEILDEMQRKLRQASRYPKSVTLFQGDMTRLLSTGNAGITATDKKGLLESIVGKRLNSFDIVSCQFAMHYAFESEIKMRGLMANIYEALRPGGVYIGTVLDGRAVFDLLQKQKVVTFTTKGQDFARITKEYTEDVLGECGQGIGVWFTSIANETKVEYLVNFDAFAATMEQDYDIKVIDDVEANSYGLPHGSGLFGSLYSDKLDKSMRLSKEEMRYSFLNRYFVMKKVGNGDGAVIQNWLKKLK